MSLWKIAWRSIQQRALASTLTAISMALGVALVVAVLVIHSVLDHSFRRGAQGYNLIVGAKGDQLRLVLNTVFHLTEPVGNIPYSYYEEFVHGRFAAAVETAIPVCMGHDYLGLPAVATVPDMFERLTYLEDQSYEFAEGRNFNADSHYEAVVGATAARETGLTIGSKFRPVAKAVEAGHRGEEGHDEFTVVGVLAPTGTPNDRALFLNIEGFFRCPAHQQGPSLSNKLLTAKAEDREPDDGKGEAPKTPAAGSNDSHDHAEPAKASPGEPHHAGPSDAHEHHDQCDHDHDHDHVHRELTAILVCTDESRLQLAMALPDVVNRESVAQAVMPSEIIARLFDGIVGNVQVLLLILACLVVIVAGMGIMVSIYNSMSDRRHEIAIMRSLGASRATVMVVVLLESILLSLGGGALGLLLGHGLIGALGPAIAQSTSIQVSMFHFQWVELVLIPGLVALASIVGYLPAVAAYRTDVAKSLASGG